MVLLEYRVRLRACRRTGEMLRPSGTDESGSMGGELVVLLLS